MIQQPKAKIHRKCRAPNIIGNIFLFVSATKWYISYQFGFQVPSVWVWFHLGMNKIKWVFHWLKKNNDKSFVFKTFFDPTTKFWLVFVQTNMYKCSRDVPKSKYNKKDQKYWILKPYFGICSDNYFIMFYIFQKTVLIRNPFYQKPS